MARRRRKGKGKRPRRAAEVPQRVVYRTPELDDKTLHEIYHGGSYVSKARLGKIVEVTGSPHGALHEPGDPVPFSPRGDSAGILSRITAPQRSRTARPRPVEDLEKFDADAEVPPEPRVPGGASVNGSTGATGFRRAAAVLIRRRISRHLRGARHAAVRSRGGRFVMAYPVRVERVCSERSRGGA